MKSIFEVAIQETLERKVKVEADSKKEAESLIRKSWKNGDYVLDADDFTGVEFNAKRVLERQRNYER